MRTEMIKLKEVTCEDIDLYNEAVEKSLFGEFLTSETLVEIIDKAVSLGWTKSIEYNKYYDVHFVYLTKASLKITLGKTKSGEFMLQCWRTK